MNKIRILAVVSVVLTVLILRWNVSLATSVPYPDWSSTDFDISDFDISEVNPEDIIEYKATEISQPSTYWTLTEPIDRYILQTISNLKWIPCRENETIFLQQVEEHNGEWKIEYQGSYYEIEALITEAPHPTWAKFIDCSPRPLHLIPRTTEHIASGIGLAGLWSGILIVWKKKP